MAKLAELQVEEHADCKACIHCQQVEAVQSQCNAAPAMRTWLRRPSERQAHTHLLLMSGKLKLGSGSTVKFVSHMYKYDPIKS